MKIDNCKLKINKLFFEIYHPLGRSAVGMTFLIN